MAEAGDWRIVLIDDEVDIRDVMSFSLHDAGYQVTTAPDGETGIGLCGTVSPQIVITDIRMPGISGLDVLKKVKQHDPEIEVIVITAFAEMDLAVQALQLDASDFITKPVNDNALHLALKRAQARYTNRKAIKEYTQLLEREKAATSLELEKTIAFQKNLIDNSMDGILACDEKDTVVIFNRSMEQILGYSKADMLRRMSLDRFFPPNEAARFNADLPSDKYGGSEKLFLYETALLNHTGQAVPVQISATVLFEQGKKSGLVCFIRDLRQLRKLEREFADQTQVLHQDKMMSLGRLAASVVHEINNPLSGILNYVRLMIRILHRKTFATDHIGRFQEYLNLVESETDRCSQIVSNLLTFSRKSPASMGTVAVDELLHRCIILSQHKLDLQQVRLDTRIPAQLPDVKGDFNQLQQCIINLIFNAVDAMPEGGSLCLSADHDSDARILRLSVEDSGTGIAESDLPHIFEPFYSTKKEGYGVGLGLSTVFGVVKRHNGDIKVTSKLGKGTCFTIELPA